MVIGSSEKAGDVEHVGARDRGNVEEVVDDEAVGGDVSRSER